MEVQTWSVDKVKIRERLRRDLGGLDDLKASLTERGLINPITVEANGTLIAGERRLRAAQDLGWNRIDVRIWRPADATELLSVEAEENLCRKDLTQGEAELYAERLEELLKPEAEANKGGRGKTAGQDQTSAKFAEVSRSDRETRKKAAKATGYSHTTLDKVREVRETAEDETQPEEVRAEAAHQHDRLMRGTAKATPAHEAVKTAKKRAKRKEHSLASGLGPGQWIEPPPPPMPEPTLSRRLVDGIGKGQGLEQLAAEIQDGTLDLDTETVFVLRNRLQEEIAARKTLKDALDQEIERRGFNRRKRTP